MALYIGANYHPHDWSPERWPIDIEMMKAAGFNTVRVGHLCWDSFEPDDGVYTFRWFDEVMDLFAKAGLRVVLDVSMRPAPVWVHKLCPGCAVCDPSGNPQPSIHRYMEDIDDPAYQHYALRFARVLVNRYKAHPALFAFGLCNEIGSGKRSFSEYSRQRFIQWLKKKYGNVAALNKAWATQRWCRRLTSFDEVVFPQNGLFTGAPEPWLDMCRFFADGTGGFLIQLAETVSSLAPDVPTSSNHYAELADLGFDYLNTCERFVDYPGMGFYPGFRVDERYHYMTGLSHQRMAEFDKPMWYLEYQAGGHGIQHGPYGAIRMMAMLSLLNRAQMILGWTWRSMLGGEEQYLCGLLDHDGTPNPNYHEYKEIAAILRKLEPYAFPYLPQPDTAVAFSYDNDCVTQYSSRHYHQTYRQNRVEVEKAFFALNRDYNAVSLLHRRKEYKLLILPEYALMSEEEAAAVRRFVAAGGTVIMTGHGATVDEHNQVFSEALPGRLSDVFGVRVAGFERAGVEWHDPTAQDILSPDGKRLLSTVVADDAQFVLDLEYYEKLELHTAAPIARFAREGWCAVSENRYGSGRAYYVAAETNAALLQWLIERITPELGLQTGLAVPAGVQARQIAPGQTFYVNTTGAPLTLSLPQPGYAVLADCSCANTLTLPAYSGELVVKE